MLAVDWLRFYRQVAEQDLTIVDLETTGYRPSFARVTEIAVIQANLKTGIQHQATTLINTHTLIPENIVRFTGITQAIVDGAPLAEQVWPQYFPLLEPGVLTCHNLEFDYPFLQAELQHCQIDFHKSSQQRLCTVILARQMLPDLPSRSLPDLVKHFRFPVGQSHRAEADAIACWLLAEHLLTEVMTLPDEALIQRFGRQWLPLREVTKILGGRQPEVIRRLQAAGVEPRRSSRSGASLYQRSAVEAVFYESQGQQLSWL